MAHINSSPEVAEVLIIGAGASGSVAAKHLAEAGVEVVCLEQGNKVEASEFYGDKPEWELMSQRRWHPNPNVRDHGLATDYPVETSDSDVDPLMYAAKKRIGGSTVLYAAHWQRFMPSDFRVKTLDGVADDWPFTYEDLEPFYDIIDVEMGVSGLAGDPAYPPMAPPPLPPFPIGAIGRKAALGMNKLGWHWWPGPQAIPTRPYRGRSQCARRGTCMQGCPEQAKASTDLTHWPDALAHGATLIRNHADGGRALAHHRRAPVGVAALHTTGPSSPARACARSRSTIVAVLAERSISTGPDRSTSSMPSA